MLNGPWQWSTTTVTKTFPTPVRVRPTHGTTGAPRSVLEGARHVLRRLCREEERATGQHPHKGWFPGVECPHEGPRRCLGTVDTGAPAVTDGTVRDTGIKGMRYCAPTVRTQRR
ncbi:hypothetical protein JCM3263A_17960 [Thermobifida fusca]